MHELAGALPHSIAQKVQESSNILPREIFHSLIPDVGYDVVAYQRLIKLVRLRLARLLYVHKPRVEVRRHGDSAVSLLVRVEHACLITRLTAVSTVLDKSGVIYQNRCRCRGLRPRHAHKRRAAEKRRAP